MVGSSGSSRGLLMHDDDLIKTLRVRVTSEAQRYPPASLEVIRSAEVRLMHPLPPLLKRVYLEVSNGGFGPGYGLIGLDGGHGDPDGRSLAALTEYFLGFGWPPRLLPLWDWGSGMWTCIDHTSPTAAIVTHDPSGAFLTPFDLASWLTSWIDGRDLFNEIFEVEVGEITNPFSGRRVPAPRVGKARGAPFS
jgi:hypothetical protein